jgi:transcription initiation factor TFIIIB Brf1 subunit/transcription initiation factor TFIIB
MAECIECGEEYSDKRVELGYKVCLKCGDVIADVQATFKAKQIAPHYNKGGYQYLTPGMDLMSLNRKI